jgi:hypothetical protein
MGFNSGFKGLTRAVRGNAPNLPADCNDAQSPPLRIVTFICTFRWSRLSSTVPCYLSGKNIPLRVRQNFVQTVPPLFCFQAIVPCIRLIRRAEMRQQMFKYESYTIRSGLFHHLQHQSPPVISPSISSSHNHNHPTVILQYTSWSRSCK